MMYTEIHINKKDIRDIIAKHYGVHPDAVIVRCEKEWVGYGMDEHEEWTVNAVIIPTKGSNLEGLWSEESKS